MTLEGNVNLEVSDAMRPILTSHLRWLKQNGPEVLRKSGHSGSPGVQQHIQLMNEVLLLGYWSVVTQKRVSDLTGID